MRTHFRSFALFILFAASLSKANAQNRVPNPSFEFYTWDCFWGTDHTGNLWRWTAPECAFYSGYYNACFTPLGFTDSSVPTNSLGFAQPSEGEAYVRLDTYGDWWPEWNPRKYLTVPLWEPLEAGQPYCIRVKLSLCDSASYRTSELHCYLGTDTPTVCFQNDEDFATNATITLNTELVDTAGWTLLEGDFVANGGESVLTIGNFHVPPNIDTTYIAHRYFSEFAGYYMDEVYLGPCDVGVASFPNNSGALLVYPNPVRAGENLNTLVNGPPGANGRYELLDTQGRAVKTGELEVAKSRIGTQGLRSGHYLLRVVHETFTTTAQVVIE